MIDRRSLATRIKEKMNKDKPIIANLLKKKNVALTTDGWSCRSQHMHYVALTAHFIQNWELKSAVLACRSHSGSSGAVEHRELLNSLLEEYGINKLSVSAIVSDTESTMASFGNMIEQYDGIPWVGCIDHRLQLIAKEAFEDNEDSLNTMTMCRELVGAFHHSDQAMEVLLKLQKGNGRQRAVVLIQDIPTRWWSTFSMIERLLRLKEPVETCINNSMIDASYRLSQEQWGILERMIKVLQPFKFAQKLCEGETYVTSSLVPTLLKQLRSGLSAIVDGHLGNMASVKTLAIKMLGRFDVEFSKHIQGRNFFLLNRRFGNARRSGISEEILVAAALDPRTKSLIGVPVDDGSIDNIWKEVEKRCFALRKEISDETKNDLTYQQIIAPVQTSPFPNYLKEFAALLNANNINHEEECPRRPYNEDEVIRTKISSEIEAFRKEPVLPVLTAKCTDISDVATVADDDDDEHLYDEGQDDGYEFSDPLRWWSVKEKDYPFLSNLASKVLCIPATSAPSERLFSAAGLTLSNDRSRLVPYVAENVVLLRKNWDLLHQCEEEK